MWSMMSVSCGWRSAMRANLGTAPTARNMTGSPAFSAAGQNQSAVPSESQASVAGVLNVKRTPSMPGCCFHVGSSAADFGSCSANAAHDSEAVGITLGGFERIVVAVVQARRHDDDAVDASLVHHWQRALDGEWFRQLRPGTWIPGPVRRICFPEMHLGVDDRALACGLRPRLLRACGQRCAGDQRRAEFASCQHDGPPCWRRSLAAFRRWKTVTWARQSAIPVPAALTAATCATIVVRAFARHRGKGCARIV